MQNSLSRYTILARRWLWLIVLGIVICGGMTYGASKLMPPVYRASAMLAISFGGSPFDSINASSAVLPTYSQMIKNPSVLNPVLANHRGLTLQQLTSMVSTNPQPNTQLLEIDVDSGDPRLAMQLANEVSYSFVSFSNSQNAQNPVLITVLPAQLPTDPFSPKPLHNALIGALSGLGLALALIFIFEWVNDRPTSLQEVQELLGTETGAVIPRLSRREGRKNVKEIPALTEGYRLICTNMNAVQALKPFKLVLVTSALADEGKSTTAANLANFLALSGKHVLLVDANLRNPVQYQHFGLDNSKGLSCILQESPQIPLRMKPYIQMTEIPTLKILPAGAQCSNFVELLQSARGQQLFNYFKKAPYDYILFDTPSLLPVADTQFLASRVHAVVFVVDISRTSRQALSQAKAVFKRMHVTILGVVANKNSLPEYNLVHHYQNALWQPEELNVSTLPLPSPGTPVEDDVLNNGMSSSPAIPVTPPTHGVSDNGKSKSVVPVTPPPVPNSEANAKKSSMEDEIDPDITITIPQPASQNSKNKE